MQMLKLYFTLFICLFCYATKAQDFFKDYQSYVLSYQPTTEWKRVAISHAKKVKFALKQVTAAKRPSLLNNDTLYLISLHNIETGQRSAFIWNSTGSCSYKDSLRRGNYSSISKLYADANTKLNELLPQFKQWVQDADTAAFTRFALTHKVFDGQFVSFTVATKKAGTWHFLSSNTYQTDIWKPE